MITKITIEYADGSKNTLEETGAQSKGSKLVDINTPEPIVPILNPTPVEPIFPSEPVAPTSTVV